MFFSPFQKKWKDKIRKEKLLMLDKGYMEFVTLVFPFEPSIITKQLYRILLLIRLDLPQ
jgi:hypothetical protein